MTIRVYLVDDHALVRTGMKMILSGEADIEVVGEAETGEDGLRDAGHRGGIQKAGDRRGGDDHDDGRTELLEHGFAP